MDRLQAMAVLLRTVDRGSFSAASRELGIPLPTVSRKVNELESHLGAKLLVRSTRKLALTAAGQVYVAAARRILEQVDDAEREAAGEFTAPKGELCVTAPLSFGRIHVLPVVAEFLATYPEIDVRLLLSDRNIHLLDENLDMALRIGVLPDSSLVATRVGFTRQIICASPALLARRGMPETPQHLASLPLVSFDVLTAADSWNFRGPSGEAVSVQIRAKLVVSTADAAVCGAIAGVGLVRLFHYQCADALADGSLQIVLPEFEPEPLPVHILHAPRGSLPFKTRAFIDFATTRLKRRMMVHDQSGS